MVAPDVLFFIPCAQLTIERSSLFTIEEMDQYLVGLFDQRCLGRKGARWGAGSV